MLVSGRVVFQGCNLMIHGLSMFPTIKRRQLSLCDLHHDGAGGHEECSLHRALPRFFQPIGGGRLLKGDGDIIKIKAVF